MLLRKFTPMIQQGEKLYLSPWTSFRTTSICNIIKMGKKESSEGDTKSIAVVNNRFHLIITRILIFNFHLFFSNSFQFYFFTLLGILLQ